MGKTRIKEKSWHTIHPSALLGHLSSQSADEEQVRLNLAKSTILAMTFPFLEYHKHALH